MSTKAKQPRKKRIPVALKEAVWRKYFDNTIDGACCVCQKVISITNHDCGHIIAEAHGGATDINNLRPVCSKCNKSMGTENMDEFTKKFNDMSEKVVKKSSVKKPSAKKSSVKKTDNVQDTEVKSDPKLDPKPVDKKIEHRMEFIKSNSNFTDYDIVYEVACNDVLFNEYKIKAEDENKKLMKCYIDICKVNNSITFKPGKMKPFKYAL